VTPRAAVRYVESLDILGMRFGLERMHALMAALGHPERGRPVIHVVGSNGKTSTSRLAAAALAGEGLLTGTYLSPHVAGWRERIEVGGRPVPAAAFARHVGAVREAAEGLARAGGDAVTQFEVLTAAAFVAFRAAGAEAMVVEAGLGGRWDATNVLQGGPDARVVVLTTVDLEHTDLLGDTHEQIAAEKLAVLPDGSDRLLVGRMGPLGEAAVRAECARRGITAWWLGQEVRVRDANRGRVHVVTPDGTHPALPLPLLGRFQRDNLAVAVAAAERLLGRALRDAPLARALRRVRVPGRLEVVAGTRPLVVLDGAHNPAGMHALAGSLPEAVGRRRPVAVMSVLGDKDARAMMAEIAPSLRAVVAARSHHPRAVAPDTLAALAREHGLRAEAVDGPPEAALARARAMAGSRGAVLVCGSLYLLADLRPGLRGPARDAGRTGDRLTRAPGRDAVAPGRAARQGG
jgi:dihydrofolate synthase/folylpolyglutamate synthase